MQKTGREGRIRTVYLYTIIDQDGNVLCKDATRHEASEALGYKSPSGIYWLWKRKEAGNDVGGLRIERRKGVVGNMPAKRLAPPKYLYTAVTPADVIVVHKGTVHDMAKHYGLTENGMRSALRTAQLRSGGGDIIKYRGDTIRRINAKGGRTHE